MLWLAVPAGLAYGRTPSPIFRVLDDMAGGAQPASIVGMHRRLWTESRRARLWRGEPPGQLLPAPRDYEWLELTRAWRDGDVPLTWFVADPRRTDLALIDPVSRQPVSYRWPFTADDVCRRRPARRARPRHDLAVRAGSWNRAGR